MSDFRPRFPGDPAINEITPLPAQLTVASEHEARLRDCVEAVTDDPSYMLADRAREDLARLSVKVISCSRPDLYAEEIAAALRPADCWIMEQQLPNATNRLRSVQDIALNLGLDHINLSTRRKPEADETAEATPVLTHILPTLLLDKASFIRSLAATPAFRERSSRPVIRTMGLGDYDFVPNSFMVEQTDTFRSDLRAAVLTGLLTDPNDVLIQRHKSSLTFSVPKARALRDTRLEALSVIVGNVMRNRSSSFPIRIDVVTKGATSELTAELLDCGVRSLSIWDVPHSEEGISLPSSDDAVMRDALEAESQAQPALLQSALLSRYVELGLSLTTTNPKKIDLLARRIYNNISAGATTAFLDAIEAAKFERLPRRMSLRRTPKMVRRRQHVGSVVLGHPIVRALTAEAV